jgi:nitrogenase-associated protein
MVTRAVAVGAISARREARILQSHLTIASARQLWRSAEMATILFWEKPGCGGNARQKALLAASGHTVVARNLLAEPWTAARLRAFFGARPVAEWFNRAAPRVKSGDVRPEALAEAEALALMLEDRLLIRRPLMQVGARCEAGFDTALVADWVGLGPAGGAAVGESCLRRPAARAP